MEVKLAVSEVFAEVFVRFCEVVVRLTYVELHGLTKLDIFAGVRTTFFVTQGGYCSVDANRI